MMLLTSPYVFSYEITKIKGSRLIFSKDEGDTSLKKGILLYIYNSSGMEMGSAEVLKVSKTKGLAKFVGLAETGFTIEGRRDEFFDKESQQGLRGYGIQISSKSAYLRTSLKNNKTAEEVVSKMSRIDLNLLLSKPITGRIEPFASLNYGYANGEIGLFDETNITKSAKPESGFSSFNFGLGTKVNLFPNEMSRKHIPYASLFARYYRGGYQEEILGKFLSVFLNELDVATAGVGLGFKSFLTDNVALSFQLETEYPFYFNIREGDDDNNLLGKEKEEIEQLFSGSNTDISHLDFKLDVGISYYFNSK